MQLRTLIWLMTVAALPGLSGCHKQTSANDQLAQLGSAFPASSNTSPSSAESSPPADANGFVRLALAAAQTNDYAGGVIALQSVQQSPALTPGQLKAVHGAMQAMTADLVARAARGDAQAKAALAAIERTRSQ